MLYTHIKSKYQHLSEQLSLIETRLQSLPDGKLICCKDGSKTKWYTSNGHSKTYIPKKEREFAEQLAEKKYLLFLKNELSHEQNLLSHYLKHHSQKPPHSMQMLESSFGYSELLQPVFKPISVELSEWASADYERNEKNMENLIHKTSLGFYVRSKSEAMIAMLLHINRIPFRYECALHLPECTLYPDFTIRHPFTGEVSYWEHFGMMDNESYSKNVFTKLQTYASNQLLPSVNLLTTFETREHPLDTELVENMIRHYFLS